MQQGSGRRAHEGSPGAGQKDREEVKDLTETEREWRAG